MRERSLGTAGCLLGLFALAVLLGCGGGAPFNIIPVRGKVTYTDGSLIPADRIIVKFVPQDVAAVGTAAPAAAQGDVNVADGTFRGLTHKHLDGAIVGRHKVVVQAFQTSSAGFDEPNGAVPSPYTRAETTPLEVDVARGNRKFTLQIERTP